MSLYHPPQDGPFQNYSSKTCYEKKLVSSLGQLLITLTNMLLHGHGDDTFA